MDFDDNASAPRRTAQVSRTRCLRSRPPRWTDRRGRLGLCDSTTAPVLRAVMDSFLSSSGTSILQPSAEGRLTMVFTTRPSASTVAGRSTCFPAPAHSRARENATPCSVSIHPFARPGRWLHHSAVRHRSPRALHLLAFERPLLSANSAAEEIGQEPSIVSTINPLPLSSSSVRRCWEAGLICQRRWLRCGAFDSSAMSSAHSSPRRALRPATRRARRPGTWPARRRT